MADEGGYVKPPERDWWDRIGEMRWQHVVLCLAVIGAFVALCFTDAGSCSVRITSEPTTTTTGAPHA